MFFRGTRFTNTTAYVRDIGALIVDIRRPTKFNMTNATYYTFVEGDLLDAIAYKLYGNASLWWAILDANPNFFSEIDIVPGDVLAIPPYEEVMKWL